MPTNVTLPTLSEGWDEARILRWLKLEGDTVAKGESLLEIESAKVITEVPSPERGLVAHIAVAENAVVEAGALLAIIAAPGEKVVPPSGEPVAPRTLSAPVEPVARRLAEAYGLDMRKVKGSGKWGKVLEADIKALVDHDALPDVQIAAITGMRRAIGRRMLRSAQTTAPFTLTTEADATQTVELRQELVASWRKEGVRPTALAFLIKASAQALRDHPLLNAWLVGESLHILKDINIGYAVAIPDGLLVPVVRLADRKTLLEITHEIVDMAKKARRDALTADDLEGGTFSITSLASFDVDAFTPILNPPQIAILGTGRIVEKPVVQDGEIKIAPRVNLSLAVDHRATDGAPAGRLLHSIKRYMEDPWWMVQAEPGRRTPRR